jgi:hypothetical protein
VQPFRDDQQSSAGWWGRVICVFLNGNGRLLQIGIVYNMLSGVVMGIGIGGLSYTVTASSVKRCMAGVLKTVMVLIGPYMHGLGRVSGCRMW